MTGQRNRLKDRRPHWLYRFECDGQVYTGGVGRFDDGRIAEVFINGSKAGTAAETNAQDSAIVASLALQFGFDHGRGSSGGPINRLQPQRGRAAR